MAVPPKITEPGERRDKKQTTGWALETQDRLRSDAAVVIAMTTKQQAAEANILGN